MKQVYGIEIVEQAIEDAKENAKINKVKMQNLYVEMLNLHLMN